MMINLHNRNVIKLREDSFVDDDDDFFGMA